MHIRSDMRLDPKTIIFGVLVSYWPGSANLCLSKTVEAPERFTKIFALGDLILDAHLGYLIPATGEFLLSTDDALSGATFSSLSPT